MGLFLQLMEKLDKNWKVTSPVLFYSFVDSSRTTCYHVYMDKNKVVPRRITWDFMSVPASAKRKEWRSDTDFLFIYCENDPKKIKSVRTSISKIAAQKKIEVTTSFVDEGWRTGFKVWRLVGPRKILSKSLDKHP